MLDLDKIRKQFKEILHSFSKEDLENWLKFAEEREERERLEEFLEGNLPLEIIRIETSPRNLMEDFPIKGLDDYNPDYAEAA